MKLKFTLEIETEDDDGVPQLVEGWALKITVKSVAPAKVTYSTAAGSIPCHHRKQTKE